MNLLSVLVASALGLVVLTVLSQGMLNQVQMRVYIEYLNDAQTARTDLELRADCKNINLAKCEVRDKVGNLVLDGTGRTVGRAFVQPVCDSEGANVFTKQIGKSNWKPLIPLKVCGGGSKVCNMIANADGISCAGGSKS